MLELGLKERGIEVVHQTGAAMRDEVAARYAELGVPAEVVSFIDDMAKAYTSASLVIARAGTTTLAELCAIGRPSILVPYPHTADDHQAKNAEALERAGAAIAIRESALTNDRLAAAVKKLLDDPTARAAMSEAARTHGKPDAAAAIVDDLFAWLGGPSEERSTSEPEQKDGDGGARFASVDFRAGRAIELERRSRRPPPPAHLELVPRAPLLD
jgi:UDP-N-acetylglucosamine--N-acetylmuramyl-(pentapeptide) pyrophosphoryl-undecaprenol N-acetylglucosamine transferase